MRSEAKNRRALAKPLAASMFWIAVVPVSFSVRAALTPWRTKKVASVTMKLGSFVRITTKPLMKPIASPKRITIAIAGQMFTSWKVAR